MTILDMRTYEPDGNGRWVSSAHRRLAEVINDYDCQMFLTQIPPESRREDDTHPYAIIHERPGYKTYVVKHFTEEELSNPEKILGELFLSDPRKASVFDRIKKEEAARAILKAKEREERMGEVLEFAKAAMGSPKHTWKHNGRNWR